MYDDPRHHPPHSSHPRPHLSLRLRRMCARGRCVGRRGGRPRPLAPILAQHQHGHRKGVKKRKAVEKSSGRRSAERPAVCTKGGESTLTGHR
eukprot:288384-Chlamydomonas_euryale.AAC.2